MKDNIQNQIQYSKRQVDSAGETLRNQGITLTPEVNSALDVLGGWRTSHTHPLQVIYMGLRDKCKKIDSKALVSQRLKRIPSIVIKLRRNQSMSLSRMQDIGGCRAVLDDIQNLRKIVKKYDSVTKDYIKEPKLDGYRSIHIVVPYKANLEKYAERSGRKIEIQLRTRLQHAWATAVETVDSLLAQNLKTGGGGQEWKRFFALSSSMIAIREKCPIVPGTPDSIERLKNEISKLSKKIDVFRKLDGLAATVETILKLTRHEKSIYILILDLEKKTITTWPFGDKDELEASLFYLDLEKKYYGNQNIQIVQVSVSQLRDLKRAFPNYYLNAKAFLDFLREEI